MVENFVLPPRPPINNANTNKREEYEARARQCLQGLHGLMTEAKREGYVVESYTHLNTSGEPVSRVTVLLR